MADGDESLRCRGMRDLLPQEMSRHRHVEETFARICAKWGYSEVRTPTIEFLHLFTAAGTLSPTMLERTYSFLDWDGWSGERVVLRPDATIPAARLYVENNPSDQVARFSYVQNVFRFSLGDESREDWQCGVELIGDLAVTGDLELLLLGFAVLAELGLAPVEVGLSHAGLVRAVLATAGLPGEEQVASYDRLLDGDLTVLRELEARLPDLKAPLHLLFDRKGGKAPYLANLRAAFSTMVPGMAPALDQLATITAVLDQTGCPYRVQTTLVRNFEYYTGPVVEFRVGGRRVGGGGRYDDLVGVMSGRKVPASGWALSVSGLASCLDEEAGESASGERWAVRPAGDDPTALADAFAAAAALRERGRCVSVSPASGRGEGERWLLVVASKESGAKFRLRDGRSGKARIFDSLDDVLAGLEKMNRD